MKSKSYMLLAVLLLVFCVFIAPVWAVTVRPLTEQERSTTLATHEVVLSHADLTTEATNTAQVVTLFETEAKAAVELVSMVLLEAFNTGNTNHTGSTLLEVGDAGDADRLLDSTELNSDGTEVWFKYGRRQSSAAITYLEPGGTTNTTTVVTGTAFGRHVFTATGAVRATVTPNVDEAVGDLIQGRVRLLFRILNQ